jgi:preprotein translocase subunit SecG
MIVLYYALMTLFVVLSVVLIMIVLVQKGRGGGLSGAFGGGGGGNTAFGTKTGDILTWATSIIFGLFMFLAVVLNIVANRIGRPQSIAPQTTSSAPQQAPASPMSPTTPAGPGAPAAPGN